MDAKLRHHRPQLKVVQTPLYSLRKLRLKVNKKKSRTTKHLLKIDFLYSDFEAKELVLNLTQGAPREDLPGSPQSPLHTHTPTRTLPSHQKYQPAHPPRLHSAILSPQTSSIAEDDFSDSNGAVAYGPPDYPIFLHNYNEEPYYPHQEMFYPYSDAEISQHHLLNSSSATQQRPFSASSSSCSSSESEHLQLQNLNSNVYCADNIHGHNFNISCFNNNQNHTQTQNWHGHEFKPISHQTLPAGYTSVIVDTQQYQLANEYVH